MIALLTLKAFYSQSPNEVQYFLIHGFIAWQLLALIDSSCSLFTHKMTPGFGREIAADRAYRPDPRIENRIFRDFRIEQIALDEELDPGEPPEWLSSRRPRNCPFQRRAVFITAP
jgi:hypothetical protein